jgi:NADPH-dependent 7-cyano-7-deazaguanine reductase QueF
MPDLERVSAATVTETVTAAVTKLCPVRDETDEGTVTIVYTTRDGALELHALAAFLASFADQRMSHEDFTAWVADATGGNVTSRWVTAGMEVTCAVVREPIQGQRTHP